MNKIERFCEDKIGILEDLIDVMEAEIEEMYLTDAEWDDIYENVIDPLHKAIGRLEIIRDIQPEDADEPSNDSDDDEYNG